uniref:non-ribosomal peptide synthetase n=1 Tax=Pseudomonas sp. RIT-To-2 TaxID=3462541 RepID=UPI002413A817
MDQTTAHRIAARFVGLPVDQRRQILDKMIATGQSFRLLPIASTRHAVSAVPLSYAQQRLFFLWQMEPDSAFYNVPMAVRLHGAVNESAMQGALTHLLDRHESLRTRFRAVEGEFFQEIVPAAPAVLEIETFTAGLDDASLRQRVQDYVALPFDLLAGPLMRVKLLRLAPDEHVVVLCMHHIVCDGWSSELMVQDFIESYSALAAGQAHPVAPLPIQYADYAIWQRAWLEAGEGERQLAYWKAQLGDEQPVLTLPLDRARPATPSYRGAVVRADVPPVLAEALRAMARKEGQTLFMLMLAAVSVVLARHTGQGDIRVGAPNAGRNRSELEGLIGFFINTQVLRVQVDESQSYAHLLEQAKSVVTGAQAHQDLPFEQLVDALVPERNLGHNPLFQFKLNQNLSAAGKARNVLGDLAVEGFALEGSAARFDLALDFTDSAQGIEALFTYATDLFDATTIERLAASLLRTLQTMVQTPHARIAEQPEPGGQVAEHSAPYPFSDFLALWRHAPRQADDVALQCNGQTMTHALLEQQSNRLAQWLRGQGAQAGTVVAVCQERSIEWVVSLLAVFKAGAVYLPLDPQQPAKRLHQLLTDSGAAMLVHAPGDNRFQGLPGRQGLAFEPEKWSHCSDLFVAVDISPAQPAYIIFTSGSTGQPKGVVISHQALANYVQGVLERLALQPGGSMAMVSTIAADLGHTVLFGALASGRELHLLARDLAFDPDGFAAYMAEHQIGVLKVVPSHLQGLLQAARAADVLPAQALILGGEACPAALVDKIRSLKPGCRVINHYGPTETTVGILTHEPVVRRQGEGAVPVGLPLGNGRARILDRYLNPVAQGVTGELYLGGAGLAQGYLHQPGLTAERFVPHADGERLYRSGDRARVVDDGLISFVGRADDQVKIRGYRVEPGEVGQLLAGIAGVREAFVHALPLEGDEARLQLVAYCVVEPGITVPALQERLLAQLPEHMVPAHILLLERLPLTANGKVDKRALPQPGVVARGFVAPVGDIESALAQVWADVLKLDQVGSADNFFELGGDSILSLQIVARAKRLGLKLTPKQLFEKQSIGALAQVVKRIEAKKPVVQAPVTGSLALLPAQARFFDADIPQRHHWNQSLLLAPRQRLETEPLAQALFTVVQHHDALRLRFAHADQAWTASFQPVNPQTLLWQHDVADTAGLQAVGEQAQASLDLENGPLLRGVLINLADGQQRLLLIAHHLVVDGVSWRVVLEDLQTTYRQLAEGGQPQPLARTCSLQQWAEHLHRHAVSPRLQAQMGVWQAMLDQPVQELPRDHAEGSQDGQHERTVMTRLDARHTQRLLKQAPAAYRTQINDLLLTALATVLCQWSRQPSVLIQLEGHGREDVFDADLSRTVGWFTSLFPVRLTPGDSLPASIKAVKEQLRAIPDRGLGYGVLRYLGTPDNRATLQALPQPRVTFNYLGQFDGSFAAEDGALFSPALENAGRSRSEQAPLGNWLSLNGQVYDGALQLEWTYSGDVYEAATIKGLALALEQCLIAITEHCSAEGAGGITPSDVPLAGLVQAQLDGLPIPASHIEDIYPLSPMQQGMLFHSLLAQGAGDYINQMRVDAQGLDVARFIAAWQRVVDRHEVLRASFIDVQGHHLQVIRRHVSFPVVSLDWRERPDAQAELAGYAQAERRRGFDLLHEPLLRLAVIRTGDDTWHLIYTQHHILLDGWSSSRLMGEVLQAYVDVLPGAPATRYRDYIQWLQQQDAARSEAFWLQQLEPLQAPTRLAPAMRQDKA